jgi:hypothetical protein
MPVLHVHVQYVYVLACAQAHAEFLPHPYHCIIHGVEFKIKVEQKRIIHKHTYS